MKIMMCNIRSIHLSIGLLLIVYFSCALESLDGRRWFLRPKIVPGTYFQEISEVKNILQHRVKLHTHSSEEKLQTVKSQLRQSK